MSTKSGSIQEEFEKYFDHHLSSAPPQNWHCRNVDSNGIEFQKKSEIIKMLLLMTEKKDIRIIANTLYELSRKIERYERELQTTDDHIKKWVKMEIARNIGYDVEPVPGMGFALYRCPNCHKCLTPEQSEPINNLKYDLIIRYKPPIIKYPKIKIP